MVSKSQGGWANIMHWLVNEWHWPAACTFTACLLLLLTPVLLHSAGLALTLVYLQLPIYMLHQWEEHTEDRFRLYFNQRIAGGREALLPIAVFYINASVWILDLAALYLACFVHLSLGLAAIYLPLVNAIVHTMSGVVNREYNPGLWTALGLFLPLGGWSLYEVSSASNATLGVHAVGIGTSVAVHAAILVYVAQQLSKKRS